MYVGHLFEVLWNFWQILKNLIDEKENQQHNHSKINIL
jgi:hypothetical protein